MTPGALNSSGRRSLASIGPRPSSGFPSGSTTLPRSASPTGTEATAPVRRTGSPSLILSHSPKSATPTLSSSRLNARPTTPWSSSSSSRETQFSSPWTRAMPSPSWSTAPTSARFVSTSNSSIRWRRIDVISSGRSFIQLTPCRCELLAKSFEAAAHARVQPHGAGLEDDPSDQIRVNRPGRVHIASRRFGDLLHDPVRLGVRERMRGRQLDVEHVLQRVGEDLELCGDLTHLAGPALLDEQAGEVADELVGAPEHALEHVCLDPRVELGVEEELGELGHVVEGVHEVIELGPHDVEAALLLRGLEERAGVDAVRRSYEWLASRAEKSISASASSIRRC